MSQEGALPKEHVSPEAPLSWRVHPHISSSVSCIFQTSSCVHLHCF
jgi:hypothetical protein